jgi:hypothetical protein
MQEGFYAEYIFQYSVTHVTTQNKTVSEMSSFATIKTLICTFINYFYVVHI